MSGKMRWQRAKLRNGGTIDVRQELGPHAREDAASRWLARNDRKEAAKARRQRRRGPKL
jgi:hypothetical protein